MVLSFAHNFPNRVSRALAPGALILLFDLPWSVVVPGGWKREGGERDGFEIRGRGNPLLPLICLVQVSLFYSACIFFLLLFAGVKSIFS